MATMNGLRVYITPVNASVSADASVFYSNGPIYRWLYEANVAHWRVLRMHGSDFKPRELCAASWKSVPEKLQAQMGEHYLD